MTEDGTLTTGGTLTVSDVDLDQSAFKAVSAGDLIGTYGDFTFHAGAWTYTLRNAEANVQALTSADHLSDVLVVSSLDGTTQAITITVNGANEIDGDPKIDFLVNNESFVSGRYVMQFHQQRPPRLC